MIRYLARCDSFTWKDLSTIPERAILDSGWLIVEAIFLVPVLSFIGICLIMLASCCIS